MSRCFDLARRGIGHVSPNPPVGAVLVYEGKILAEGYHHFFGGPHAEVDAISNVREEDKHLIALSTLFVSLEPCCISGKTGPCTDLIIKNKIKKVVISVTDPNPAVAGKGVERLEHNGIEVTTGVLTKEGQALISAFTTTMRLKRPHVVLKWAQSKYGYAGKEGAQIWFSGPGSKTWSHSQRAMADAIMVGARTVETDDPSLTTRNYPGDSPQRVIYDPNGRLHENFKVFMDDVNVHYYSNTPNKNIQSEHIRRIVLSDPENHLSEILTDLLNHQIGILLVEGGPFLQKQFIKQDLGMKPGLFKLNIHWMKVFYRQMYMGSYCSNRNLKRIRYWGF